MRSSSLTHPIARAKLGGGDELGALEPVDSVSVERGRFFEFAAGASPEAMLNSVYPPMVQASRRRLPQRSARRTSSQAATAPRFTPATSNPPADFESPKSPRKSGRICVMAMRS
jgi:hypothetical protein